MCGLVGIASSKMEVKHERALALLLYLDSVRGEDSTGVASIDATGGVNTLKQAIPGSVFVDTSLFRRFTSLSDRVWIGHNRAKTIGAATAANAHPFEALDDEGFCYLVGAHNGTLTNKGVLPYHANYGTDSEALFNAIAFDGLSETIAKVEGAWALVWYDLVEEELRFLSNGKRPLYYGFEKEHKTLLWASRPWMLQAAATECGIAIESIVAFPEDVLMSAKISDTGVTLTQKHSVKGKSPPVVVTHPPVSNVVSMPQKGKGYKGEYLSGKELEEALASGCSWCELEFIETTDKFAWLGPQLPVCHKCLTGVPDIRHSHRAQA